MPISGAGSKKCQSCGCFYIKPVKDGSEEVKRHVFWDNLNWQMLEKKQIEPPFRPKLTKDKNGVWGTTNFDPEFTGNFMLSCLRETTLDIF